ncbi:hypothetical protein SPAR85_1596 [Streptococcus pneumoniae GA44500]|nr:hypothetical protein SPAR85_1596 [Streptococcus pneumoniae GA44500]
MVVLANHPNWQVYSDEIAKRKGVSRDTVDRYFKILEKMATYELLKKAWDVVKEFVFSDFSQM